MGPPTFEIFSTSVFHCEKFKDNIYETFDGSSASVALPMTGILFGSLLAFSSSSFFILASSSAI